MIVYSSIKDDCNNCENALKTYQELAEKNRNREDIWFVKMDGSKNELLEFEFDEYPTIIGFKKGSRREPIVFEGDVGLELLEQFVEVNL